MIPTKVVWCLVVVWLLTGCNSLASPASTDPFLVVQEPFQVRLSVEPAAPRAGEEVQLTFLVIDAATGQPTDAVTMRPTVSMTMAQGVMGVPTQGVERVGPGQFRTNARLDHEGTLRISVSLASDGLVTPVRFGDISIAP